MTVTAADPVFTTRERHPSRADGYLVLTAIWPESLEEPALEPPPPPVSTAPAGQVACASDAPTRGTVGGDGDGLAAIGPRPREALRGLHTRR